MSCKCALKANCSARVPKNLGGPRPLQEVVSARLKRGPPARAETRGILVLRVFALMTDNKSEGSGVENYGGPEGTSLAHKNVTISLQLWHPSLKNIVVFCAHLTVLLRNERLFPKKLRSFS